MKNWYVITGAPCSGKTTLLDKLRDLGYLVVPEVARAYIDESISKGIPVETLRSDELKFQEEVLARKYKLEESLGESEVIFLDRGIPDSYAYLKFLGIDDEELLSKSLSGKYKKVFILDPCPYKEDYARTESPEDQLKIHSLLREAYQKSGAVIISVPIFETKEERVDFVINNL
jgi:predicted ATPase